MTRFLALVTAALLLGATAGPGLAAPERLREFDSPAQAERYQALLEDLRCLVCQNQSLASSDADLAKDLRDEVYRLLVKEGKSDEAVVEFLVQRYGDFVLYRPPIKPATYLLWAGPFLLLAVGATVLVVVVRHKSTRNGGGGDDTLSPEERARVNALLGTESDEEGKG